MPRIWWLLLVLWMSVLPLAAQPTGEAFSDLEAWKGRAFGDPQGTQAAALAFFESQTLTDEELVSAAYILGLTEYLLGHHRASLDWYQWALDELDGGDVALEAALLNNQGINWDVLGHAEEAQAAYAASREREVAVGDWSGAWQSATNEALLLSATGRMESADSLLDLARAHFEAITDDQHVAHVYMNKGAVARDDRRWDDAMQHGQEARRRFAALGDSLGVLHALALEGEVTELRGDAQGWDALLDEVEAWSAQFVPPNLRAFLDLLEIKWALRRRDLQSAEELLAAAMARSGDGWGVEEELELMRLGADLAQAKGDAGQIQPYLLHFDSAFQDLMRQQREEQLMDMRALGAQRQLRDEVGDLRDGLNASRRTSALLVGLVALLGLFFVFAIQFRRQGALARRILFRVVSDQMRDEQSEAVTEPVDEGKGARLREVYGDLVQLMREEKVYLNPQLTLGETSARLKTNATYLGQALQQERQMGFTEYVNSLRIQDARRLMLSEANLGLSFEQIASQCGFSNARTFYRQFQNFTNMTPGQFRQMVLEQSGRS